MGKILEKLSLSVRMEAVLGAIFIYAAIHKIADPPDFAHMIYNYKLMPGFIINLLAIYLPWIELVAGVALVTGTLSRGGAALVGGMLLVFIAALSINLLRGHAVDCGCFTVQASEKTCQELIVDMRWTIVRDIGMLLMLAYIFYWGGRREAGPSPGPAG